MTITTLEGMHSDASALTFLNLVTALQQKLGVDEAQVPRRRKLPTRLDDGAPGFCHDSVESFYRASYFEAIDLAMSSIRDRFDQPGYATYRKLEDLLLNACQGREYREQLQYLCDLYQELDVQLQSLKSQFAQSDECCIKACIAFLQELSLPARTYFSEVVKVVQLILVMPATNAVSERSFSTMRRIKSYLRSTMHQDHLNHLMTLHIYQDK